MDFNFDQTIDRSRFDSIKWHYFDPDILPMWVADMDFLSPPVVVQALVERAHHGIYGYGSEPAALREVIRERLERLYAWKVPAAAIVFLPGVISGFNLCCSAFTQPGDSLVIQTPVYPPILHAHQNHGLQSRQNSLVCGPDSRYDVDYDDFAAARREKPGMFLLCNPHNPVGIVFQRGELERLAELCLASDYLICSDEIHGDLIFSESKHIPIASLDGAIARRTITLMAPSKTFNIAGLDCSLAVIPDEDLR
ncbi:MAG TPA: aminotransferase class I/II-fold pyridoxal phosphate-dependent enzyme, partial [Anaerolineaceae bacterium]